MADETAYRSESLASRIAQLALIDSLYTIVMFSNEERSRESLSEIREAISATRVNS
jgi:DNA-binding MurR/RpiR family transcriptional regulator